MQFMYLLVAEIKLKTKFKLIHFIFREDLCHNKTHHQHYRKMRLFK